MSMLLKTDPKLHQNFLLFAEIIQEAYEKGVNGEFVDILGVGNVVVVVNGESKMLRLIDPHMKYFKKNGPELKNEQQRLKDRMEQIAILQELLL